MFLYFNHTNLNNFSILIYIYTIIHKLEIFIQIEKYILIISWI